VLISWLQLLQLPLITSTDFHSVHISQALVDSAMAEIDMAEDATTKDGSGYENGVA
jgi:hypothetical protein